MLHHKICEYKSYLNELRPHVSYIQDLFSQSEESVSSWLALQGVFLKAIITENLKIFMEQDRKTVSEETREELRDLCSALEKEIETDLSLVKNTSITDSNPNTEELDDTHLSESTKNNVSTITKQARRLSLEHLSECLSHIGLSKRKANTIRSWFNSALDYLSLSKVVSLCPLRKEIIQKTHLEEIKELFSNDKNMSFIIDELLKGEIESFKEYWNFLESFDPESNFRHFNYNDPHNRSIFLLENEIRNSFVALKSFCSLVTLMIGYLAEETATSLLHTTPGKNFSKIKLKELFVSPTPTLGQTPATPAAITAFSDMVSIYNAVAKLPLRETVDALNNLSGALKKTVTTFKEQQEKEDPSWKRTMWFKLPFALSVVAIKIFEHYCQLGNEKQEQNFSLFGKTTKPNFPSFGNPPFSSSFSLMSNL